MRQPQDEADRQTGWQPIYTWVVGTLLLTLILLGLFSRYFSG